MDQRHKGTTTIVGGGHILRDAQMTAAAVRAPEESGIRAASARGTAKPPARPRETPYYAMLCPPPDITRLRGAPVGSDGRRVPLAMANVGADWGEYDFAAHDIRLPREYGHVNAAQTYGR